MIRKNILQGPVASDGHHGSVLHVPAGFVIDGGPGNLSRVAGRNHGKGGGSRAKVGRGKAQDVAPDTGVAHVAYGTHPHHILGLRRKIRQHLRRNGILHIHPTIARQSVVNRQTLHTQLGVAWIGERHRSSQEIRNLIMCAGTIYALDLAIVHNIIEVGMIA